MVTTEELDAIRLPIDRFLSMKYKQFPHTEFEFLCKLPGIAETDIIQLRNILNETNIWISTKEEKREGRLVLAKIIKDYLKYCGVI